MERKWHLYIQRVATKKHGTIETNYSAWDDDDAIDKSRIKRLIIESKYSEIVAYEILNKETDKIICKNVYDNILDMI